AESVCGLVSPRIAHERTRPEASSLNASNVGTADGSRGRNSAHVARHRSSSISDFVHLTIAELSPLGMARPIDNSASPIVSFVRGVLATVERYRANTARAWAVLIFPSATAASVATVGAVLGFDNS